MLNMRSAPEQDLTTRARIRDAAIDLVAQTGDTPTMRAIAQAAGVSPALVVHHFRSKDGLQEECDAFVLQQFHALATDAGGYGSGDLLAQLARKREAAPIIGYAIQALMDGRPFAFRLFELLVDDTARYLAAGVVDGAIRPTADERARATMLTTYSLGTLVLARYALAAGPADSTPTEPETPLARIDRVQKLFGPPVLDIFTHGLFTDDRLLRAYQAYQEGTS